MQIPRSPGLDCTIALWREGYNFLPRRFARLGTDIFQTRLWLQKAVCVTGTEAAALFYDPRLFQRRHAAPKRTQKTLFGRGGVQGLDGRAHLERKAMFMSLMNRASIERLVQLVRRHWREALPRWQAHARVDLVVAVRKVLIRAVCEWAATPLPADQVERRAAQFAALVDAGGGVGLRYWRGRIARIQADAWLAGVIQDVRRGRLRPPEGTALHVVAWHRECGELLTPRVAAVELNNVLRATVAVDRYVALIARALHEHGDQLAELEPAWSWTDRADTIAFVQEVRRYYPYFPFVAARTREAFEWRGYQLPKGRRVLLDLYGTNHDERVWPDAHRFRPDRFRACEVTPFTLIPQGGGDYYSNHRCAGEWITIAIMAAAAQLLTQEMRYRVADFSRPLDYGRFPAQTASGLFIEDVRQIIDPSPPDRRD